MRDLDTLKSLQADMLLSLEAIDAGQVQIARTTLTAWSERLSDKIADREAPRFASWKQCGMLATLTGKPARHFQELQLSPGWNGEAGEAIQELKLAGSCEIRGTTYYRITSEQQEHNAALRHKLGTTKGRTRKAA